MMYRKVYSPVFKNKTLIKDVRNNILYSSIFSKLKEEAFFNAFKFLSSVCTECVNFSTPSVFLVPFPLLPQMLGNSDP